LHLDGNYERLVCFNYFVVSDLLIACNREREQAISPERKGVYFNDCHRSA